MEGGWEFLPAIGNTCCPANWENAMIPWLYEAKQTTPLCTVQDHQGRSVPHTQPIETQHLTHTLWLTWKLSGSSAQTRGITPLWCVYTTRSVTLNHGTIDTDIIILSYVWYLLLFIIWTSHTLVWHNITVSEILVQIDPKWLKNGSNLIKTFRDKIQNIKHFFLSNFSGPYINPGVLACQQIETSSQLVYIQQGKTINNQFSYMGQNVKNLYFWLFGVCVWEGGFNDQTGPILLSSYPLTHIYDHVK